MRGLVGLTVVLCALPLLANAHASEQGFVLLLPTDFYVAGGAAVVALTIGLLAVAPSWRPDRLLRPLVQVPRLPVGVAPFTQIGALLAALVLIGAGTSGPTDPLRNPLTLGFWTVFWIGIVGVQAVLFDIWRWVNPFAGLWRVLAVLGIGTRPALSAPSRWVGVALFLGFSGFLLADPAPADPGRLSVMALGYLCVTGLALALFGQRWLVTGEFFTVFLRVYRRNAILGPSLGRTGLGVNGWRIIRLCTPSLATAVLMLLLLGSGSFDGMNETFWWLGLLGINPLEFPGRSAVIAPTIAGLLVMNAALILAYSVSIRLGEALAGGGVPFGLAFCALAPSILPIAAGYHIAHYLTSFLVDGQHVISALSVAVGAGERPVTTGFFNRLDSVRIIWLAQAAAVVLGHVIAILVAHAIAQRLYPTPRQATLSQLPLALFMVAYTVFGLWLLAAPKGA